MLKLETIVFIFYNFYLKLYIVLYLLIILQLMGFVLHLHCADVSILWILSILCRCVNFSSFFPVETMWKPTNNAMFFFFLFFVGWFCLEGNPRKQFQVLVVLQCYHMCSYLVKSMILFHKTMKGTTRIFVLTLQRTGPKPYNLSFVS